MCRTHEKETSTSITHYSIQCKQECSQLTGVTDLASRGVGFGVVGLSRSDPTSDASLPKRGVGLWWGRDDWLLITVLGVVVVELESDSPPGLVISSLSLTGKTPTNNRVRQGIMQLPQSEGGFLAQHTGHN
jgi:hypothetical protein